MELSELLKKPYARLVMPDEDGTFTAEIVEFPGCIASGPSAAEALAALESVAVDWIAAALDQGQQIPEPLDAAGYSGKLVVRMSKNLHKKAALYAERDGVSLNQFIVNCISEEVGLRARPLFVQTQPIATAITAIQLMAGTVNLAGWPNQFATSSNKWLGPLFQGRKDVIYAGS